MSTTEPKPNVLTRENVRKHNLLLALNFDTFIESFNTVPWFSRLGQPSLWDKGCVRIRSWNEWPGPENPAGEAFAGQYQALYDWLGIDSEAKLQQLFNTTLNTVMDKASKNVAEYDPEQDPWHGPSQSVNEAAYCAGLIACNIQVGTPVHEDLQELWAWFQNGHWPCSFAGSSDKSQRLLLVY